MLALMHLMIYTHDYMHNLCIARAPAGQPSAHIGTARLPGWLPTFVQACTHSAHAHHPDNTDIYMPTFAHIVPVADTGRRGWGPPHASLIATLAHPTCTLPLPKNNSTTWHLLSAIQHTTAPPCIRSKACCTLHPLTSTPPPPHHSRLRCHPHPGLPPLRPPHPHPEH